MLTERLLTKILLAFLSPLILFTAACGTSAVSLNEKPSAKQQPQPAPSTNPNRKKIVAFGDSLTIGLGLTEKESYPSLIQEKLNADGYDYQVINAGVSGDTSAGGLERIDWTLNQPNIEILILELGANDMLRGLPIKQMKENLRQIIQKAKAKNIEVLFCGMYAPVQIGNAYQREFMAAFKELADEEKVVFLPFFLEGVGGVKNLNQADGIHPNAEGTKIIAGTVYKQLKPMLKK
jgi:acyl-CoA thioesterase I